MLRELIEAYYNKSFVVLPAVKGKKCPALNWRDITCGSSILRKISASGDFQSTGSSFEGLEGLGSSLPLYTLQEGENS